MITFLTAVLALAAIAVVAWPLVKGSRGGNRLVEDTEVSELLAQKDAALLAISELESDYSMGSLSQTDYRELRQRYEEKAVALMKTADELKSEHGLDAVGSIDGEIEARVARLRRGGNGHTSCPGCSGTVGIDDRFCSRCGAALGVKCPQCAAAVSAEDRFCFRCGAALGGDRADEP